MRKIYISGRITGDSGYIGKFEEAEKKVRQQYKGCEVINPAAIMQAMPESTTHEEYMKISLCLLDMCDSIYLLPDWKESKGANMEYRRALDMGHQILGDAAMPRLQGEGGRHDKVRDCVKRVLLKLHD